MANRALKNVLAFLVALLVTMWAGFSFGAAPEQGYEANSSSNTSSIRTAITAQCPDAVAAARDARAFNAMDAAVLSAAACMPESVPLSSVTYTKSGAVYFVATNSYRVDYTCTLNAGGPCAGGPWYGTVATNPVMFCWDLSDPVGGVCPEPPSCGGDVGQSKNWTGPGALPESICISNCRWTVGQGIYLPGNGPGGTWYGQVSGTGSSCTGATSGAAPTPTQPNQPIIDPVPVTEHDVTTDPPTTNGDTTTQETTESTNTSPGGETTVTETTITHEVTGAHGVTKTTTTTTTTHADGSTTTNTTTTYTETTPDRTVTNIPGGTTTTPGTTRNGTTTTTTNTNPDGSSNTSTTHTGVGGDGQSGPGAGGGDGECVGADCGDGDPCGEFVPQHICDWFQTPELDQTPVLVPEIESAPGSYSSGLGTGSCPGAIGVNLGMFGSHSVSLQPLCDFALNIRPLVIAISYLMAAFIVVGGRGK